MSSGRFISPTSMLQSIDPCAIPENTKKDSFAKKLTIYASRCDYEGLPQSIILNRNVCDVNNEDVSFRLLRENETTFT